MKSFLKCDVKIFFVKILKTSNEITIKFRSHEIQICTSFLIFYETKSFSKSNLAVSTEKSTFKTECYHLFKHFYFLVLRAKLDDFVDGIFSGFKTTIGRIQDI